MATVCHTAPPKGHKLWWNSVVESAGEPVCTFNAETYFCSIKIQIYTVLKFCIVFAIFHSFCPSADLFSHNASVGETLGLGKRLTELNEK